MIIHRMTLYHKIQLGGTSVLQQGQKYLKGLYFYKSLEYMSLLMAYVIKLWVEILYLYHFCLFDNFI